MLGGPWIGSPELGHRLTLPCITHVVGWRVANVYLYIIYNTYYMQPTILNYQKSATWLLTKDVSSFAR